MPDHPLQPGGVSVIEALRGATRSRHAALAASAPMCRLFAGDYTLSEYRVHLGRLLGIFEPLERVAARAADPRDPVHAPCRSGDLRQDLQCMGSTADEIDELDRCPRLPAIAPRGLRGYTYVMLGSMLGGKIIVRRLRAVLGPTASFRFYGDEGSRYEALWASFCLDLEQNGKTDAGAICTAAVAIFDAYAAWLSKPLPPDGPRR